MNKIYFGMLLLTVFFVGCGKKTISVEDKLKGTEHSHISTYYTCPMHPQIKKEKPGKCPICHMNLTKVEVEETDAITTPPLDSIQKEIWSCKNNPKITSEQEDICPTDGSPMIKNEMKLNAGKVMENVKLRKSQLDHFHPAFFPVTQMKMSKKIRLLGSVLQSEQRESKISARVSGRIEKVHVVSTGSFIKKGDPVVDIYSPDLITAGEEYFLARKSYTKLKTKEFKELLKQSEERLLLWGIKNFQYENWFKNQKIPNSITLYSPTTGVVQKRNATAGKYFKEGQNFFELSELSDVWVEMDVYEQDSSLIQMGQNIELEFISIPGEIFQGVVDFVNPVLNPKSRTLKIRTTLINPSGKLRPGMVADATLEVNFEGQSLVVPRSAIIDTGKRKIVWVKISPSSFQSKVIYTGFESEGYVEIKDGLKENEEVVIEGNFILDAQAQLFGGHEDVKEQKEHVH